MKKLTKTEQLWLERFEKHNYKYDPYLTLKELGDIYGVSREWVRVMKNKLGIEKYKPNKDDVLLSYINGLSYEELAEKYHIKVSDIPKYIGSKQMANFKRRERHYGVEMLKEGYALLSNYKGNQTPLRFMCPNGHYHYITPVSWDKGCRCEKCADENRIGQISKATAERNKEEWLNIDSYFYIIKLINEEEEFYKYGVTTQRDYTRRFDAIKPYDYTIVELSKDSLYHNAIKEDSMVDKVVLYEPKHSFGGSGECFTELIGELE